MYWSEIGIFFAGYLFGILCCFKEIKFYLCHRETISEIFKNKKTMG